MSTQTPLDREAGIRRRVAESPAHWWACAAAGAMTLVLGTPPVPALGSEPPPPASESKPGADFLWQPIGRLAHDPIKECSGIVASRKHPGIFWIHNDSGHDAVLYAVKVSGELVAEVRVAGAANSDWEDLAIDSDGNLYVGDIGNNFGMFPVRSVYRLPEPDPVADNGKTVQAEHRYRFSYPDDRFNSEGLYTRAGRLFVVSRVVGSQTAIYEVETHEGQTKRVKKVAALNVPDVTGTDVSADGRWLAVCTTSSVHVFALDANGLPDEAEPPRGVRFPRSGVEACCFDGDAVVVASETRDIYRVTAAQLEAGTVFRRPPRPKRPSTPR